MCVICVMFGTKSVLQYGASIFYGLWRNTAFIFMAYGRKSKFGEIAINRIFRRNTAEMTIFVGKSGQMLPFLAIFQKIKMFMNRF